MNKHNLMRKIASVATELDYVGFTKEAKKMDLMLLKLAQEEMQDIHQGYFNQNNVEKKDIEKKDNNNFKELTHFLDQFPQIKYIVHSGNVEVIDNLSLSNHKITFLPESFGYMKIGGSLDLGSNKLIFLPESFGSLKVGGDLNLDSNNLTSLPESFGYMKIGGSLSLSDNKLESLPESFGNLKIGGDLRLGHNNLNLKSLPKSFANLKVGGEIHIKNQGPRKYEYRGLFD